MLHATRNTITLACLITLTTSCYGYGLGPPLDACADMFPQGHGVDAQMTEPPFRFTLSAFQYFPGSVINVTLEATSVLFMEGTMIQARTYDCSRSDPIGTFSVASNEDFLKPMTCFGESSSALGHYSHLHVYTKTVYWKAPATAVGHVHFRATVARNRTLFWTNVFSRLIIDASDKTALDLEPCPAKYTKSAASMASLQSLLFAIPIFLAMME